MSIIVSGHLQIIEEIKEVIKELISKQYLTTEKYFQMFNDVLITLTDLLLQNVGKKIFY